MDLFEDETYLQKHQSKIMTVNDKNLNDGYRSDYNVIDKELCFL